MIALGAASVASLSVVGAQAEGRRAPIAARRAIEASPWSAGTRARIEVDAGRALVVRLFVPLCSNDQIDCGSAAAGRPRDLAQNLYWGAAFGVRHFFDRKKSGWERLGISRDEPGELERVAYRRWVSGGLWGRARPVELVLVASAIDGDRIDEAVASFWATASKGGRVAFEDGGARREERVSIVGYAGHDRLMDGLALPSEPTVPQRAAIPTFVLACYSEKYFGPALRRVGATPLLSTKALMAPEAYTIDALLGALGDDVSAEEARDRSVAAYAKWQRITLATASSIFE